MLWGGGGGGESIVGSPEWGVQLNHWFLMHSKVQNGKVQKNSMLAVSAHQESRNEEYAHLTATSLVDQAPGCLPAVFRHSGLYSSPDEQQKTALPEEHCGSFTRKVKTGSNSKIPSNVLFGDNSTEASELRATFIVALDYRERTSQSPAN